MNVILAISPGIRLLVLFVLGLLAAGLVNLCVYRLAWRRRDISPWSLAPLKTQRTWVDRVPLLGWWRLRREGALHGRFFWIRPLLVELLLGLSLAALYDWEVDQHGLYAFMHPLAPPVGALVNVNFDGVLHAQFLAHALLLLLMLVATLIDFDEQTIPDAITVPGTLMALVLASLCPWSLLPADVWLQNNGQRAVEFLSLCSPETWDPALAPGPVGWPLAAALGAWTLWCGGLLERRFRSRHGLVAALRFFVVRLWVDPRTWRTAGLWAVGAASIVAFAALAPLANWAALLSALIGMLAGGGVIWIVRVVGSGALGREAMGFGDVTLMAMIGAFVGWQPSLIIFFLGPLLGVLFAVVGRIVSGNSEIPYGPFLCMATAVVIVGWANLWDSTRDIFAMGWLVPAVVGVGLALMGIILLVYRQILDRVVGNTHAR